MFINHVTDVTYILLKTLQTDSLFSCGFEALVRSLFQSARMVQQLACYSSQYPLDGALEALLWLRRNQRVGGKNIKPRTEIKYAILLHMYRSLTHYVREPEGKRIAVLQEQKQQEALQHCGMTFSLQILPVILLDCVNYSNTIHRICTSH